MNKVINKKFPNLNLQLDLIYNDYTFKPTYTSDLLIDSCIKNMQDDNKSVLDLGCGISVVNLALFHRFKKKKYFGSDLSEESIKISKLNSKKYNANINLRIGNCFEPWKNYKFDTIVNDVSGVASKIAKVSNWFRNIPSESGEDGTELIGTILNQSKAYLNKNGNIYFPIISLSNKNKILDFAYKNFKSVKLLKVKKWFLPEDLENQIELLNELKEKKFVDFKFEFGKIICYSEIYTAFGPNE